MTIHQALAQVDRLWVLKQPRRTAKAAEAAREELAEKLMEWCRGTQGATPLQQAEWLMTKVTTELNEYPGPQTLHAMLIDRFYPAGQAAVYRAPKPEPIACPRCHDNGWVEDGEGTNHWCQCGAASLLREEVPEWLDTLNSLSKPRKPKQRIKLSAAQFESRIGL